LHQAIAEVSEQRARFVEKYRKRLLKEQSARRAEAEADCHRLTDALAAARERLRDERQAELWCALYADETAGREAPNSFCGGRTKPLSKLGITNAVPAYVFEALHADIDHIASAVTGEQATKLADTKHLDADSVWVNTDEGREQVARDTERIRENRLLRALFE
jgi:hypothetical protein